MPKKKKKQLSVTSMVVSTAQNLDMGGDPTIRTLFEVLEDSLLDFRRKPSVFPPQGEEFHRSVAKILKELANRLPHLKEFLASLPADVGTDTRDWLAVKVISGEVTVKFDKTR